MPPKKNYTDPKLRDEVKQEIQDGDKGGAPGQWSARKAQMMASEYKKRGGDYNTDKSEKDESQKNLDKWGEEDWQTKEGSGHAKKQNGTQKRYLPKEAWENMSEGEREETDEKKQEESKRGKQHVENTGKAKESRKKATRSGRKGENVKTNGKKQNSNAKKDQEEDNDDDDEGQANGADHGNKEDEEAENDEGENDDEETANAGRKRNKQSDGSSKKRKTDSGEGKQEKTVGSKHQPAKEPAPRGSKDRLPQKGQAIQWKAMPGYVDGEVVEVLTQGKTVDGKSVKASRDDPKIVLKSSSSGKICVHKPDACFFG